MIYYLRSSEKYRSRALWEEAFPEDSRMFLDYYYQEKIKDNQILVKEEGGHIVSMLHRNPYQIAAGPHRWECSYLVGVATEQGSRRRGFMRELMEKSLADMRNEGMPFSFLMPALRELYLPFGFADIFQMPVFRPKEAHISADLRSVRLSGDLPEMTAEKIARFMNRWLQERYEVYAVRSKEYVDRLYKEILSEDGTMAFLIQKDCSDKNGGIAGIRAEWGLVKKEQRILMCGEPYYSVKNSAGPGIMGRIVDLPEFVKAIRLKEGSAEKEITLILGVIDPQLPENHGIWQWRIGKESSLTERISEKLTAPEADGESSEADLILDIGALTAWLFGFRTPKESEPYCEKIRTLKGVYLDEIV